MKAKLTISGHRGPGCARRAAWQNGSSADLSVCRQMRGCKELQPVNAPVELKLREASTVISIMVRHITRDDAVNTFCLSCQHNKTAVSMDCAASPLRTLCI